MARYTGPVCRLCRRASEKLFLKGERCFTTRCAVERRRGAPGPQTRRQRRPTDYGLHLREKQKARHIYGVLEAQFRKYINEAFNKPGVTGQYLLQLLERRLDNVVYRLGFAESRRQARQLVLHGQFKVNGRKMDIPSYSVRAGDLVSWKETEMEKDYFKVLTEGLPKRPVPQWLRLNIGDINGTVSNLPGEEDTLSTIDARLIVEFYSR